MHTFVLMSLSLIHILHNLESIVTFGYTGASPALMGACAERNIDLCFMKSNGHFLARVTGKVKGNVLLRKEQYREMCIRDRYTVTGYVYGNEVVVIVLVPRS